MISFLLFYGIALIFLNFLGYPFFWSIFVAEAISGTLSLLLNGKFIEAIFHFLIWSIALSIYEDGRQKDVKFKFWFAVISLFIPPIGIPLYLILRNRLSSKIGKTLKSKEGKLTFYNK
jgi:hypothetical protein